MPYKNPIKNAEYKKQYRLANKEKTATMDRQYYLDNKPTIDARKKAWRAANPDKWKARRREQTLRKYGLTVANYNKMLMEQDSCCKLCGYSPDDYLDVDHQHVEGYDKLPLEQRRQLVRGLLCDPCNKALGLFRDNPVLMRKAADYVELLKPIKQPRLDKLMSSL